MTALYFSKVNTKNIKALTGDQSRLKYGCGIMGKLRSADSRGFEFSPNNNKDDWFYITFKSATKIKEEIKSIFDSSLNK